MEEKKYITKSNVYTKTIWQCCLWLFEVIGIPSLLVFLYSLIVPFPTNASFVDYVERYLLFYAVYQIAVFCILNSINDARRDALLALISTLKWTQLYFQSNNQILLEAIQKQCTAQTDTGLLNQTDIIKQYQIIEAIVVQPEDDTKDYINMQLVLYEHAYEATTFQWRYSFLVRLFK